MVAYADTGFIVSIYREETTSERASHLVNRLSEPLPLTPLLLLEFRNAINLAVKRGEFDLRQRDSVWRAFEADISNGVFAHAPVSTPEIYLKARELSDTHSPKIGTRSLDLLHIATALVLGSKEFLTFDDRQAKAAKAEGLKVRP